MDQLIVAQTRIDGSLPRIVIGGVFGFSGVGRFLAHKEYFEFEIVFDREVSSSLETLRKTSETFARYGIGGFTRRVVDFRQNRFL
jgi:hypothetical protein